MNLTFSYTFSFKMFRCTLYINIANIFIVFIGNNILPGSSLDDSAMKILHLNR